MPKIELVTPFLVGDCVVVKLRSGDSNQVFDVYVYGVVVKIVIEVTQTGGEQASVLAYTIIDTRGKRHGGVFIEDMETLGYFAKNQKYKMCEYAKANGVYLSEEGAEYAH